MAQKESKEGVKPLLYIAQPDFEEAKLNLQHSYVVKVNKQEQKTKEKEYVATKYEEVVEELEEDLKEDVVLEVTEDETETVTEIPDNAWMKKPFKAMTNEEKVLFMLNKPHYIPKVECRIRTDKELYIGYIMGYNEGKVSIKVSSKSNNIELDIKNINSIHMVGI